MKFTVSNDSDEILEVISKARYKKKNILWQNRSDQRLIFEIDDFEYDPIREVIRCKVNDLDAIETDLNIYVKLAFRNTIFKGSVKAIYKDFVYIQVPDEIRLEELRQYPRYVFTPNENRLDKSQCSSPYK